MNKAYIVEFPIGGIITDGEKLLFNNSNAPSPLELVVKSIHIYEHSTVEDLEWQLKCSTLITEEQRESIAQLRDAVKQLKSEAYEF